MKFISTRGQSPPVGFIDVLLGGPAPDGGLYLPDQWPHISRLPHRPYAHVAFSVMRPFVNDAFTDAELREDIDAAYAAFDAPDVAPLVQLGRNRYLLELFHGPTLAFKDVALQVLGRMFARALAKQATRATVIVATSGDTGSAAIAAFRSRPNVDIVVLHPEGRVSEVQRRQMTSVPDANVHNVALDGSFDDTQRIVKALFADADFAKRAHLTAVNSINFARIAAQCVYYFTAAAKLGEPPVFVVPTGNFGDVFAGEAAMRMGLPIRQFVAATNANDILVRALSTGVYEPGPARPTLSPSMDIQVASNFERALFVASGRDSAWMASAMTEFARDERLFIAPHVLHALRRTYAAASATDAETVAAIARVHTETGKTIDPHTATGFVAAEKLNDEVGEGPVIFLATAHPAKFPEAIARAGLPPPELPPALANIMQAEERCTMLPNDVAAVRRFITERVTPRAQRKT